MTKILYIVTQSEFGGAQRYIYELVKHLNPEGYEFFIAAGEGDEELFQKSLKLKTKNAKLQLKTQKLRYLKRTPWPWDLCLSVLELFNLIRRERPDILFLSSTTAGLLGAIAVALVKLTTGDYRFKTVYRIGGWAFKDPKPAILNQALILEERLSARVKDKIIVNSQQDLELALKYEIAPAQKLVKIYNGIDAEKISLFSREEARRILKELLPETCDFKTEAILLGTVANFYKTKGLRYLIEALHLLTQYSEAEVQCVIIGDGRERKSLSGLIRQYNLQNKVFLPGHLPDARRYLTALDIFVLPSVKEGFPWVILEAMTAGIPIIATKVGAVPEIIEADSEGILVEPKNGNSLAQKIVWALEHRRETKIMAQKAEEKLKRDFTLEKMVSQTEKVLQTL